MQGSNILERISQEDSNGSNNNFGPGTIIAKRYKIISELGSGGMGIVYKIKDIKNKNKVFALKRLFSSGKEADKARFLREYKLLKIIEHENLIKAYDCFEYNNDLFMVLEFIKGKSLKEILNSDSINDLTLLQQIVIANNIARGLEVLNAAGIIHRDIKPANIMINIKKNVVKILDLGVGKDMMDLNQTRALSIPGMPIGTLPYMSPEQANGKVTLSSDIFSLGVTLYQFFAKAKVSPFYDKQIYTIMAMLAEKDPEPLLKVVTANEDMFNISRNDEKMVYRDLTLLLAKAMEKDPSKRHQDAGFIADDLEDYFNFLVSKNEFFMGDKKSKILNLSKKMNNKLRSSLKRHSLQFATDEDTINTVSIRKVNLSFLYQLHDKDFFYKFLLILGIVICLTISTVVYIKRSMADNIFYKKGLIQYKNSSYSKAIKYWLVALKEEPKLKKKIYPLLSDAYSQQSRKFFIEDKFSDGERSLLLALKYEPKTIKKFYNIAKHLYVTENYKLAKTYYQAILRKVKNNDELYFNLANVYIKLKNKEIAEKYIKKAIFIKKKIKYDLFLTKLLFLKKEYQIVVDKLSQIIKLDNSNIEVYFFRSLALYKIGKTDEAIIDMKKVLVKNDLNTQKYIEKAKFFNCHELINIVLKKQSYDKNNINKISKKLINNNINNTEESVRHNNKSENFINNKTKTKKNLSLVDRLYLIARKYNEGNNYEQAKHYYKRILRMKPNHKGALFFLAELLYEQQSYNEALISYSKFLKLFPKNQDALLKRGIIYCDKLGKYKLAIKDFKKLTEIDSKDDTAYHNLYVAYRKNEQYEIAIKCLDLAIKYNPQRSSFYHKRGHLFILLKKFDLAAKDFQKYIDKIGINNCHVKNIYYLAMSYYNTNNFKQAIKYLDLVVKNGDKQQYYREIRQCKRLIKELRRKNIK